MYLKKRISDHVSIINNLNEEFYKKFNFLCEMSLKKIIKGGKIIFIGNGGSAADAMHFSAELVGKFKREREPIDSICLNTNISNLTAIANDYSYENIFVRQLKSTVKKDDVLIAISTSGKSKNIISSLNYCIDNQIFCSLWTGGKLLDLKSDCDICVPSKETDLIQEVLFLVGHSFCEYLENNFDKKIEF